MKNVMGIIVAGVMALLMGCGGGRYPQALLVADSLMDSHPDSALAMLEGMEAQMDGESKSVRMRYHLLRHQAMNKAYIPFTSDSLMLDIVDYYDRHGTPNDQMLAHYLLGCVYRDIREVPKAIDCYLDAASKADTTSGHCEYNTLGRIYTQMAELYHKQLLWSYEIESRQKASHVFFLANDTLSAIYHIGMTASPYILIGERERAETVLHEAMRLYEEHGFIKEGIRASTMLMYLYMDQQERLPDLKGLIERYETMSGLFDPNHELPPSIRQFYHYKGKYYETIGRLDSADYYYRKQYRPKMSYAAQNLMYKGLLSIYKKRHQPDSIAKYAQLYCMANDSSIVLRDQEQTARLAASYDYTHYQKEAREKDAKLHKREIFLILFAVIVGIVTLIAIYSWNQYRKNLQKKRDRIEAEHKKCLNRLKAEHRQAIESYTEKLEQLQQLEHKHQHIINTIQRELGRTQSENQNIKSENAESKRIIEELNVQHLEETEKLKGEMAIYIDKVEELERQIRISDYKQKSIPFLDLGIVKRVSLFAKDSKRILSNSDIKLLIDSVNDYYPDLICDLNSAPNVSELGRIVCILVALHLQPSEITHLLDISPQQVGNLKKNINTSLFHDSTALTLYKNLSSRYKLPSCL